MRTDPTWRGNLDATEKIAHCLIIVEWQCEFESDAGELIEAKF